MSRRVLTLACAVSLAGASAACGASSPTAAPTASTVVTITASAAATTGNADQFCAVIRQQKSLLQGTQLTELLTGGTPDAWKAYIDQTAAMNQQLVDTAPPEVKADVKTLQDSSLALKSALEAANYDITKIGAVQLIALVNTPERKTATTHLVTYVQTACQIDLTKV